MEKFPIQFFNILILMGAGLVAFLVCRFLNLSNAVGYLAVGIILGPSVGGVVKPGPLLEVLGEVGVLFFLFSVGIELPLHRFRALRKYMLGLGGGQMLLTTLVFFGLGTFCFDLPKHVAFALACALSFSSTALIIQLLSERFELSTQLGRSALSILLFQDVVAIALFVYVGIFGSLQEPDPNSANLMGKVLFGFCAIPGACVFIGSIARRTFDHNPSVEYVTPFILLSICSMGVLSAYFNISSEYGAFILGMSFANIKFRHQIVNQIYFFRSLFMSFFLIGIGAHISILVLWQQMIWILCLLTVILLIKFVATYGLGRFMDLSPAISVQLATLIAGAGEFLFMVLPSPMIAQALGEEKVAILFGVSFLSMVLSPFFYMGMKHLLWRKSKKSDPLPKQDLTIEAHPKVVIAGFGKTGEAVSKILDNNLIPHLIVDYDVWKVHKYRKEKKSIVCGDLRDYGFLTKAKLEEADVLVITFGYRHALIEVIKTLRHTYPDLRICIQLPDLKYASVFSGLGVSIILPEIVGTGMRMASETLKFLGFHENCADRMSHVGNAPPFSENNS